MSLVIAGERSGVGKTTVTMALLAYLRKWCDRVQSFKVGPDYIDPMFHQRVTGRVCRNLDPVLTSEAYVQQCFTRHSQTADYALVEGVMGLFDGASGADDFASTAHLARLLNLPILLVIDCSRMSRSVAAIAHGYRSFDPRLRFAGVVLNRAGSDRHLDLLKTALEPLNLPILGVFRRHDEITIPDRHLGLVPTDELPGLDALLERLAALAAEAFDWERMLPLLQAEPGSVAEQESEPVPERVRLAVARDRAFSFYYADNLERLQTLGAELVFWSPLQDEAVPPDVSGLYFGGGFPEVFAETLAANHMARQSVKQAIASGMPAYAECGGLMYLSQGLTDFAGQFWSMVGVLPTTTQMGKRLTLGYRKAIAPQKTPLLEAGETVWGHEFHRSHLTQLPTQPLYHLTNYDASLPLTPEGWYTQRVHASYVHLHWGGEGAIAKRFLSLCRASSTPYQTV